jgi:hypothetical protein
MLPRSCGTAFRIDVPRFKARDQSPALNGLLLTLGRPVVSLDFAGCQVPVDPGQRIGRHARSPRPRSSGPFWVPESGTVLTTCEEFCTQRVTAERSQVDTHC